MNMQNNLVSPVVKTVRVNADPKRAFEVFAGSMGRWWPADHHIGTTAFTDIVVEPRAGGRFYEKGSDGAECDWGCVKAYEPGQRLLLGWQLNAEWEYDPEFEVEVEVTFKSVGEQTEVRLEHRNLERYGAVAPEIAQSISGEGGWPSILASFGACCDDEECCPDPDCC